MTEHDEVERRLRGLFGDARLAVPPADGARDAVVAGVRRVRRRRQLAAAGSAAGVVTIAAAGVLFALPPSSGSDVPAAAPTRGTAVERTDSSPTQPSLAEPSDETLTRAHPSVAGSVPGKIAASTSATTSPAVERPSTGTPIRERPAATGIGMGTVGPEGWPSLKLRMTFEDVRTAGFIAGDSAPPVDCTWYPAERDRTHVVEVAFDDEGLTMIAIGPEGRTAEGVGVGSEWDQVQQTYPEGTSREKDTYRVPTSAGTYLFTAGGKGTVERFTLAANEC